MGFKGKHTEATKKKIKESMEKPIPWDKIELFVRSGATQARICECLTVDTRTLSARVKDKYGEDWQTFCMRLRSEGVMLLEASQFQKALKSSSPGNSQMLIWLGKVRLGQREPEAMVNTTPPRQDELDKDALIMELQHKLRLSEENANKSEAG